MKPFTFIFLTTFLLIACGPSETERQIVGQWSYSYSHSSNVVADTSAHIPTAHMTFLLENIDVFKEDHTESESGSFEIYYDLTLGEYGVTNTIILEYATDYEGTWDVSDDYLVMTGESCTYKFVKGYALRPNPYFDEDYYVDLMKNYSDTAVVQPLIQLQLKENKTHIFKLTPTSMTLKYDNLLNMQTLSRVPKNL